MADTTYLKNVVEPFLLAQVSKKIKEPLEKKKVVVGKDSGGRSVEYEFDGVSRDGTVGVCISCSTSCKTGQMRKFFMDAVVLNRVRRFRRRIMVFLDSLMWEAFKNQCDGLIDLRRIEPMFFKSLKPGMNKKIEEIYKASASEVGNKSGRGRRIPGKRSRRVARSGICRSVAASGSGKVLIKESKRYEKKPFLYWWDIWPALAKSLGAYDSVRFVEKNSGRWCEVPPEALMGFLSAARRTTRGKGNWGIRVLKGRENELAFEPGAKDARWLVLPVKWMGKSN